MTPSANRVPMRWPSGPLEIAVRKQSGKLTSETAEMLRKWEDPAAAIGLTRGTPVNCLVVSWAAGLSEDGEQQRALGPFVKRVREAGLAVIGLVRSAGKPTGAVELGGSHEGLKEIPWGRSEELVWGSTTAVMALTDGVWPRVQTRDDNETVVAGPTTLPWVESNGALLTAAKAKAPEKEVWLAVDPPPGADGRSPDQYLLALADAAVYGGRWVISLDDGMRLKLASRDPLALAAWKQIIGAQEFFERHREQLLDPADGLLAVISSFSGENLHLAHETLNLLPRRRLPFRAVEKSRALDMPLKGLRALFYADKDPPGEPLRQKLLGFANAGGTLFVRAGWSKADGPSLPAPPHLAFILYRAGKGIVAIAKDRDPDPYDLACDIQTMMSHGGAMLRLFNGMSMNCLLRSAPQGERAAVHLVNYSRKPGIPASLYLRKKYQSAKLITLETGKKVPLEFVKQPDGGAELPLPLFAIYGAVLLES